MVSAAARIFERALNHARWVKDSARIDVLLTLVAVAAMTGAILAVRHGLLLGGALYPDICWTDRPDGPCIPPDKGDPHRWVAGGLLSGLLAVATSVLLWRRR